VWRVVAAPVVTTPVVTTPVVATEAQVTDEAHPLPPDERGGPDESPRGGPGEGEPGGQPGQPGSAARFPAADYAAEVAGDPDEEAELEAALLADIQRSMAGLDDDAEGPGELWGRPDAAGRDAARGPAGGGGNVRRLPPGPRGDMMPGERAPGEAALSEAKTVRLTAWLRGRVQGVGFRWWARSRALELGLSGWAENLADGRVKVVAEGPRDACAELLDLLDSRDTPGQVEHVTHRWDAARGGLVGFAER
jgi:acylphosphatase